MITSYQIRTMENQEEVLILFLSREEEFSSEWFQKLKSNTIDEFIQKHHIFWNGTKVFLVVGGITLAVLNYHPPKKSAVSYLPDNLLAPLIAEQILEEEEQGSIEQEEVTFQDTKEESKNEEDSKGNSSSSTNSSKPNTTKPNKPPQSSSSNNSNSNNSTPPSSSVETPSEKPSPPEVDTTYYVTVYRSNGQVVKLAMEDYLIGVVAAEMPASFHIEALKVQSIIARTYALKTINSGKKLTDTTSTQSYIDTNQMKNKWGSSYSTYYQKIQNAVRSTENIVVTYQGSLIDAVYHSTSNGKTEDSENVWGNAFPYLKSVDSSWDKSASTYLRSTTISKAKFLTTFALSEEDYSVEILSRNRSGRVTSVRVGNQTYSATTFRTKLSLRSTDFDIELQEENVIITTRGYGHGVGVSQYGANGMAKEGYSASQIIKHYYSGVQLTNQQIK